MSDSMLSALERLANAVEVIRSDIHEAAEVDMQWEAVENAMDACRALTACDARLAATCILCKCECHHVFDLDPIVERNDHVCSCSNCDRLDARAEEGECEDGGHVEWCEFPRGATAQGQPRNPAVSSCCTGGHAVHAACGEIFTSPTSLAFSMAARTQHEAECPKCARSRGAGVA